MKIMIDANVVISGFILPDSRIANMIKHIIKYNNLFLCRYVVNEVVDVFTKKFKKEPKEIVDYMNRISVEILHLDSFNLSNYPTMPDPDDIEVLANAIEFNVDILITGDKDFDEVKIDKPRIMKPREYMDEYMI